jgi:hypothetical protein
MICSCWSRHTKRHFTWKQPERLRLYPGVTARNDVSILLACEYRFRIFPVHVLKRRSGPVDIVLMSTSALRSFQVHLSASTSACKVSVASKASFTDQGLFACPPQFLPQDRGGYRNVLLRQLFLDCLLLVDGQGHD